MDNELKLLMTVSRALPRVRGAGRVATLFQKIYQRRPRTTLVAPVMDFKMRLNPNELVDSGLLFYPQLYDRREIALLRRELHRGDVFLDLGANIGFYSLIAASCVGKSGRVVAIEADPEMFQILKENAAMNHFENIEAVCVGISDRVETLRLGVNMNGNRGSSSFLAHDQPKGVQVSCIPLSQVVKDRGIEAIAAAKVDIEGYGVKALRRYYEEVRSALFPRLMITEDEPGLQELMSSQGYDEIGFWGFNRVYRRREIS
jgi:FkbM family methyltransferase